MKRWIWILMAGLGLTAPRPNIHGAAVPPTISYQGRVASNNGHYNGDGYFKFALVNADGSTLYWANDPIPGGETSPANAVALPVEQGLFRVALGDTALPNMASLPVDVFANPDVHLRVWFSDDNEAFELMSPDQTIHSVGYAMMSANIPDGSIDAEKIAPGSIESGHLAPGSVGETQLADGSVTGAKLAGGAVNSSHLNSSLSLRELTLETASGLNRIELSGSGDSGIVRMNHGAIGRFLELSGTENGGQLRLYDRLGGMLTGQTTVALESHQTGGQAALYQDNGLPGVRLFGQEGNTAGGRARFSNAAGQDTFVVLGGGNPTSGSEVRLANGEGQTTIELDGQWTPANGGAIRLFKADGTASIRLQADYNGAGRIIADVIQINGADLSEGFDITSPDIAPEPGMLVSIDPHAPGKLVLSSQAYDRTAAGVVSGAGGVRPGLLMGQRDTLADGKYPVALTGRVYCNVDADIAPIRPGDLITTSDVPGYGMKAVDHDRAQGAIIGKAMTSLASGRGQVLVLISLQ